MLLRRRKGATLGLVAIVVLVLIVVGTAVFFLAKILGGGREIANATDAGVLNVAKHVIRDARVPTPGAFQDCEYPLGCGYINLLTYNRCVAKAIMIAGNASVMTGAGDYKAKAGAVIDQLETLGNDLSNKIKTSNGYFNDVKNTVRMASFLGINDSGDCNLAYMKPNGPSNIFFNGQQLNGITIPISTTSLGPKNQGNYVAAGQGQGYMAGYAPITVLGRTIYAVPVFPQQNPHLVSYLDFKSASQKFGSAPPNAVEVGSNTIEQKTNLLTGAIACAIVGAVEKGSAGSGGNNVGQTLLGSGFQFASAASYGYIEFGNLPANFAPPGYNSNDYSNNIFNNELMEINFMALGDSGTSQLANHVAYGVDADSVNQWVTWAKKVKNGTASADSPPSPASPVYVGGASENLQGRALVAGSRPNSATIDLLASILQSPQGMCAQQLDFTDGLQGPCIAALPSITSTYNHDIPTKTNGSDQQFSQADWAKAELLTDFEGRNPVNGTYNNTAIINLTDTPSSGLGVYAAINGRVPTNPPNMSTPPATLPLQAPGTIMQLINAVQPAGCANTTITEIINRCKQIQPKAGDGQVRGLLASQPLKMGPPSNIASWDNAQKMYIYLPNGDLSADLILSTAPPPKLTGSAPDGCCGYGSSGPNAACYTNQYFLDGSIVDSENDQKVHIRPYINIDNADPLRVIDHAEWQPGSGADNNFGRMTFGESGFGRTTFTHIN